MGEDPPSRRVHLPIEKNLTQWWGVHSVADDRTTCVNRAVTKPCIFMQREGVEHVSSIHNCSGKLYSLGTKGDGTVGDRRIFHMAAKNCLSPFLSVEIYFERKIRIARSERVVISSSWHTEQVVDELR